MEYGVRSIESRVWNGAPGFDPCLLDLRVVEPVFVCERTALYPPHLWVQGGRAGVMGLMAREQVEGGGGGREGGRKGGRRLK